MGVGVGGVEGAGWGMEAVLPKGAGMLEIPQVNANSRKILTCHILELLTPV